MKTQHHICFADSRRLPELAGESVQLVVTSPPYWQLKDYGNEAQLGFHDSYQDYIENLNLTWQECARVLAPGCRLAVNIGDQFCRAAYYGRYKVIPIREEVIRCCETLGLDYMGAIIWQKVTTCNTSGGATIMGSFGFPRNGILKLDYEFILLFKKPGHTPPPSAQAKADARLSTADWNSYFAGHWNFPGARGEEHLAPFPEELPRRLIRMFTFPGETVLDPFAGSATTSLAAARLGRNSIAYEIAPAMRPLIEAKLGLGADRLLAEVPDMQVEFGSPARAPWDPAAALAGLPYRFQDPVRVERAADPRARTYGSRVSRRQPRERAPRLRVTEILGPDRVLLSDGRELRLRGIAVPPDRAAAALAWLAEKVRGEAVEVKQDPGRPAAGDPSAYLYLANRTFVNAHLIKKGLALAQRDGNYRCRERFLAYEAGAD